MLKELGFYKGVNLGGWMSQCDYSPERLDGFITEEDFAQIARWGFDHVRLPVDYNILQTPEGELLEAGFVRVDRAVRLAEENGLRLVLDLHKTQGFSFDAGEREDGFFESEKYQEYFYRIWEAFAKRFGTKPETVAFELLNELTEASYLPAWKRVSAECIRRIRAYAPETIILVGSYHWNSARTVAELAPPQDSRVLYNFHCYEPMIFTHQGAYWNEEFKDIKGISFAASGADETFFEELLSGAIEKAAREGTELYCGEYGVIDRVPPEEALLWFEALHRVLERHGIARAVWSYRQMDFGLADARMDAVRDRLRQNL